MFLSTIVSYLLKSTKVLNRVVGYYKLLTTTIFKWQHVNGIVCINMKHYILILCIYLIYNHNTPLDLFLRVNINIPHYNILNNIRHSDVTDQIQQ